MSSFLTALASVAGQGYAGADEARQEKLTQQEKQQRLGIESSYLDLAKQAAQRQQEQFEFQKKAGDLIEFKDGRIWSVSKAKFIDPQRPSTVDILKDFIGRQDKSIQPELESAARAVMELDPSQPLKAYEKVEQIAKDHKAEVARRNKVDPIIAAQIGKPPDPGDYPQGEKDPAYKLAEKKWGINAETVKKRIANSAAEARGMYRAGPYIDTEGYIHTAYAWEAISKGWVPYTAGFQSMSRNQQISEMQGASSKLRAAIDNLGPDDAFSAAQVVQLRMATGTEEPTAFRAILDNVMAGSLNEHQQEYLVWLQQMGERVLSLRSISGMGQGAQDLRAAIQATLPGITSGSKQFAIKRLDAVDNQVRILGAGIPKTNINTTPQNTPSLDDILNKKFGPAKGGS